MIWENGYEYPSMPWIHCISDQWWGLNHDSQNFSYKWEVLFMTAKSSIIPVQMSLSTPGMLRDYSTQQQLFFKNEDSFWGTITCRVIEMLTASLLFLAKSTQIHRFRVGRACTCFPYFLSSFIFSLLFYFFLSSPLVFFLSVYCVVGGERTQRRKGTYQRGAREMGYNYVSK